MTIRDEFVVDIGIRDKNTGEKKLYAIQDLDYFDDILQEENTRFWSNVRRGWAIVFMQKSDKWDEANIVEMCKLPVRDAVKKFG